MSDLLQIKLRSRPDGQILLHFRYMAPTELGADGQVRSWFSVERGGFTATYNFQSTPRTAREFADLLEEAPSIADDSSARDTPMGGSCELCDVVKVDVHWFDRNKMEVDFKVKYAWGAVMHDRTQFFSEDDTDVAVPTRNVAYNK